MPFDISWCSDIDISDTICAYRLHLHKFYHNISGLRLVDMFQCFCPTSQINLNGVWYSSPRYAGPSMNGIVWDLWAEHFKGYSLRKTEMKLRPQPFGRTVRHH